MPDAPASTNRTTDTAFRWLFRVLASFTILIVFLIFVFMGREAVPFFSKEAFTELFQARWVPVSFQDTRFGLLPLLNGTLLVTLIAVAIGIPFGVVSAAYIAEIARPSERELLKPCVEILATIPSVVLGFFGLVVIAPVVKQLLDLDTSLNALIGGLVLALMAIPTITSVSEDALRSVPQSFRQAAIALGASRQRVLWTVTVPAAIPGISAAIMLGFGRIIGETMAVLMVTGNAPQLTWSPLEPVRTMTATIAAEMGEATQGSAHYNALFVVGVVLLIMTFALNMTAVAIFRRFGGR